MPSTRPPNPQSHRRRTIRSLVAGAALLGLVLALAACGGGSSQSASSPGAAGGQARPGGRGGFAAAQDPKVQACLKQQGVTLPAPARRGGAPGAGTGTNTRPPAGVGGRPPGGQQRDPAQFAKLRAALAKCGVQLPSRPGGPPGGPGQTPTSTTAS
ncbi:MAG: hypothetical protein QOE11_1402 [Solirubrobacteraceae bacterium]|nr:hypothetical protein [Solirubrobacteraceae bacterium]